MSFEPHPHWFFGVIHQPGIWAVSDEGPGIVARVNNYPCSQSMAHCWVAYLGQIPDIKMPPAIDTQDVIRCLNDNTLPPNPKYSYYPDRDLADKITKLYEASSLIESLRTSIRARANTTS